MYRAKISFSGLISMSAGEVREIGNPDLVKELLRAGFIEETDEKPEILEPEEPKEEEPEEEPAEEPEEELKEEAEEEKKPKTKTKVAPLRRIHNTGSKVINMLKSKDDNKKN